MKNLFFAAVLGLPVLASVADEYQWTGAVGSDFENPGNWLVKSGDVWIATATPPRNGYGLDDIVFDGEPGSNMPVLGSDYTVRRVFFRSGGWTLDTGDYTLEVSHGYGGTRPVTGLGTLYDEFGIEDSSGSGVQNTIYGTIKTVPGLKMKVDEGGILRVDAVLTTSRGSYGSAQQQFGFFGEGTLILGGDVTNFVNGDGSFQRFIMEGGTLRLAKTSGFAVSHPVLSSGLVIMDADNQIPGTYGKSNGGPWYLSGNTVVDINHTTQKFRTLALGAKPGSKGTGVAWTGSVLHTENLHFGDGANMDVELIVHPTVAAPVHLDGGLKDACGRWSGKTNFRVSDIPGEPVELILDGPFADGRTGGNDGHNIYFEGNSTHYDETDTDETTYGAIALNANTTAKSQYFSTYVRTTLFVNGDAATGTSLPVGGVLNVEAPHGALRGHGRVMMSTANKQSNRTIDIYGTLAPGSVEQPAGTLTLDRSDTNYTIATILHTNSVFQIMVAPDGSCPQVVQAVGTFQIDGPVAAVMEEDVEVSPAAPGATLLISGDVPPAEGVTHRLLTSNGTLAGTFDNVVVDFPDANGYNIQVRYGTNTIDLRVSKIGTIFLTK